MQDDGNAKIVRSGTRRRGNIYAASLRLKLQYYNLVHKLLY
jgi:hypothetical protein